MATDRDGHRLARGEVRPLTAGETALARDIFGSALEPAGVTVRRRKWFPFQPRQTVMAPCGHIHFHPAGSLYCDDFSTAGPSAQGLFVHELTHVWQTQRHGRWWLPLRRHPFCRYDYTLKADWPIERYGIEQQAEIVRHAWFSRMGWRIPDDHSPQILDCLLRSVQQRTRRS
ncbi:vgr related protein [Novosphingobium flavum]|uniref:vgr related protein n=1 Tax=Novosphingobium aerophilum TaxID=2839843 RepID=UPI00163B33E8|nr:vgr related protein [Novosphingobium aerophilum]